MTHNINFYNKNYEIITELMSKLPHTYTTLLSENGTLNAYTSSKTLKQVDSKMKESLEYVNKTDIPDSCETPKLLKNYAKLDENAFSFKSQKDYFAGQLGIFKSYEKILNEAANYDIKQDLYLNIPFYKSENIPVGFVFIMLKPEEKQLFLPKIIKRLSDDFTNNYQFFFTSSKKILST